MAAWQLAAVDFVLKGGKWASVQLRSVSIAGGREKQEEKVKLNLRATSGRGRNFELRELKLQLQYCYSANLYSAD